jgi:ABC-type transporter lipoprotein component MlaA
MPETKQPETKSEKQVARERALGEVILPEHELKVRTAQNQADEVGIALAHDEYHAAREEYLDARERKAKELEKEKESSE